MACPLHIASSWQFKMNDMIFNFMSQEAMYNLLKDCSSHEEWVSQCKLAIDVVYNVPMEKGNRSVKKSYKDFADKDRIMAAAVSAASKKAKSKKGKKGQSKTAAAKELRKLLGPQPLGGFTKCDSILGKDMGKRNKDGTAYFIYPPLEAAARANWPHKTIITKKNSTTWDQGEEVLVGFWASPNPDHPVYQAMTDEQLVYYKLKEAPTQGSPMAGGGAAATAAPVDELESGVSWLAKPQEASPQMMESKEDQTPAKVAALKRLERFRRKSIWSDLNASVEARHAAKVAALKRLERFRLKSIWGDFNASLEARNAAKVALANKEAARKRIWDILQVIKTRPLVYPDNTHWRFVSPMDMDALNACLFATKHMHDAIMWRCNQRKYQLKESKDEEEMRTHWFGTWKTMNASARRGDTETLQDQLTNADASKFGIYKGMPSSEVLDNVFSAGFKRALKKTKDNVTISSSEIGEDGLEAKLLEYARLCSMHGKSGGAKWVTDLIQAHDSYDTDSDDSDIGGW